MSTSGLKGINAVGHLGWVKYKCRICARVLDISEDIVYACPSCKDKYNAYFCSADAKRLHYRCPFCGRELTPISPWLVETRQETRQTRRGPRRFPAYR